MKTPPPLKMCLQHRYVRASGRTPAAKDVGCGTPHTRESVPRRPGARMCTCRTSRTEARTVFHPSSSRKRRWWGARSWVRPCALGQIAADIRPQRHHTAARRRHVTCARARVPRCVRSPDTRPPLTAQNVDLGSWSVCAPKHTAGEVDTLPFRPAIWDPLAVDWGLSGPLTYNVGQRPQI